MCCVILQYLYSSILYASAWCSHHPAMLKVCNVHKKHDQVFAPKTICPKCVTVPKKSKNVSCAPKPMCKKCETVPKKPKKPKVSHNYWPGDAAHTHNMTDSCVKLWVFLVFWVQSHTFSTSVWGQSVHLWFFWGTLTHFEQIGVGFLGTVTDFEHIGVGFLGTVTHF